MSGFSVDGNTIYFAREDPARGKLFLHQAERVDGSWVHVELLPFSGEHNDYGGRFTPDGATFYFTSDRPGGSPNVHDGWNIWVVNQNDPGWSEPVPLMDINGKGSECCPLPMDDGSLLFSSDRGEPEEWWIYSIRDQQETTVAALTFDEGWQWPSFFVASAEVLLLNSMRRPDTRGQDDIYVALRDDETWSTPVNIGEPVNTLDYEDGALLSPDEELLIFNRHETASSPSRVMCIAWKPLLDRLREQFHQE